MKEFEQPFGKSKKRGKPFKVAIPVKNFKYIFRLMSKSGSIENQTFIFTGDTRERDNKYIFINVQHGNQTFMLPARFSYLHRFNLVEEIPYIEETSDVKKTQEKEQEKEQEEKQNMEQKENEEFIRRTNARLKAIQREEKEEAEKIIGKKIETLLKQFNDENGEYLAEGESYMTVLNQINVIFKRFFDVGLY